MEKNDILTVIRDHYQKLTSNPEPEEEEDAQKDLTKLFSQLMPHLEEDTELYSCAYDLTKIISAWDTLESWFDEVEELQEKMKNFLVKSDVSMEEKVDKQQGIEKSSNKEKTNNDEFSKKEEELRKKAEELAQLEEKLKQQQAQLNIQQKPIKPHPEKPKITTKLMAPKITLPKIMKPDKFITPNSSHSPKKGIKIDLDASLSEPIKIKEIPIKTNTGLTPKIRQIKDYTGYVEEEAGIQEKRTSRPKISIRPTQESVDAPQKSRQMISIKPTQESVDAPQKSRQKISIRPTQESVDAPQEQKVVEIEKEKHAVDFLGRPIGVKHDVPEMSSDSPLEEKIDPNHELYYKFIQQENVQFYLEKMLEKIQSSFSRKQITKDNYKNQRNKINSKLSAIKQNIETLETQIYIL